MQFMEISLFPQSCTSKLSPQDKLIFSNKKEAVQKTYQKIKIAFLAFPSVFRWLNAFCPKCLWKRGKRAHSYCAEEMEKMP